MPPGEPPPPPPCPQTGSVITDKAKNRIDACIPLRIDFELFLYYSPGASLRLSHLCTIAGMRFTLALFIPLAALAQPQPQVPMATPPPLRQIANLIDDYGNTRRYAAENAVVEPAAAGEQRVVLMGDSITDNMHNVQKFGPFFPGKPYLNRGISVQTTAQMLLRFYPDVIALQPKAVVIFGGTNDIAGNLGAVSIESIQDNLAAMAD